MNVRISFATSLVSLMIVYGLSFGFTQLNSTQQINVINNTKKPVGVSFPLPGKTSATIQLKKINDLYAAISSDSASKIREAVNAGANINQEINGKTPLAWALLLNSDTAFRTLLELGAKPDDICARYALSKVNRATILLLIIKHGYINFDRGYIERNICFVNSENDAGIALDIIKELANRGFNVNWLWQPAIYLAQSDQLKGEEAVRFLLGHGANPNDLYCGTPLFMAAVNGRNKRIVEILLDAGADINYNMNPNGCPHTVLDSVLEQNMYDPQPRRKEIIELFRERGACI